MNDDASTAGASRRDRAANTFKRGAKWLGAIVVASLVLPALTTQWADRQNELALKEAFISQLTLSAATAIEEAHALTLDEIQPGPLRTETLRARYSAIATAWNIEIYTLESKLKAYFPDAKLRKKPHRALSEAVRTYNERVQNFILLSSDICADNDLLKDALTYLATYLPSIKQEVWDTLRSTATRDDLNACWKRTEEFRRVYQEPLGVKLLEKRQALVDAIIESGAEGYNVGFRDFLRQIIPLV